MHIKGKTNNIDSLSYVDLFIDCGFGEKYAKQFTKFINDTFSYYDYSCYPQNNNVFVKLLATEDDRNFNINFVFTKNELSKTVNLQIVSTLMPTMLSYTYDSFNSFLSVIKNIMENAEFKKQFKSKKIPSIFE